MNAIEFDFKRKKNSKINGVRLNSQLVENGRSPNSIYLFDVITAAYIGRFNNISIHEFLHSWKYK